MEESGIGKDRNCRGEPNGHLLVALLYCFSVLLTVGTSNLNMELPLSHVEIQTPFVDAWKAISKTFDKSKATPTVLL